MGDRDSRTLVRFYFNGQEETLPQDWDLHVSLTTLGLQVYVERDGEIWPLEKALALRDVLTTSSKPVNRSAIQTDSKRG